MKHSCISYTLAGCNFNLGISFVFYYSIAFMRRIYASIHVMGFLVIWISMHKYWLNSDKLLNYDLILLINRVKSTQIAAFVKEQRFLLFSTLFSPPTLNLHSIANGTFISMIYNTGDTAVRYCKANVNVCYPLNNILF